MQVSYNICTDGIMCHRVLRRTGSVKNFQNLFHWRNNLSSLRAVYCRLHLSKLHKGSFGSKEGPW